LFATSQRDGKGSRDFFLNLNKKAAILQDVNKMYAYREEPNWKPLYRKVFSQHSGWFSSIMLSTPFWIYLEMAAQLKLQLLFQHFSMFPRLLQNHSFILQKNQYANIVFPYTSWKLCLKHSFLFSFCLSC